MVLIYNILVIDCQDEGKRKSGNVEPGNATEFEGRTDGNLRHGFTQLEKEINRLTAENTKLRTGPYDEAQQQTVQGKLKTHRSGEKTGRPPEGEVETYQYSWEAWHYSHLDRVGENVELEFVGPNSVPFSVPLKLRLKRISANFGGPGRLVSCSAYWERAFETVEVRRGAVRA
jgi:hypothetical protein